MNYWKLCILFIIWTSQGTEFWTKEASFITVKLFCDANEGKNNINKKQRISEVYVIANFNDSWYMSDENMMM